MNIRDVRTWYKGESTSMGQILFQSERHKGGELSQVAATNPNTISTSSQRQLLQFSGMFLLFVA